MDVTDERACAAAVTALHTTIEAWLTGRGPRDPAAFAAFADAHAPTFTMITPDGARLTRDDLLPGFETAHASAPGLVIRIEEVDVVRADTHTITATYVERQHGPAGSNARRSTVIFDRDPTAPHGLRSRHLHETWIADA